MPILYSGGIAGGGGGTPGGSNGQVQYNNAGAFGGLASSGTGDIVRATSPSLITPALGTPASGNLANCTGIFVTCMEMDYALTTAPSGWVRKNGGSIGNAASAATERANADTEALFTALWGAYADAQCPVSGGRGASAAADFAANKRLTLPDHRGRAAVPQDAATFATLGGAVGAETHTLIEAELPLHTHEYQDTTPGTNDVENSTADPISAVTSLNHAPTASSTAGGGEAHNNIQPSCIVGCRIIKL